MSRVAVITGASRGIGAATASVLAGQGFRVVVNYRSSAEEADEVVRAITAAGGQAMAIRADVTEADQVDAMVREIEQRWAGVDVLVHNALIPFDVTSFADLTWEHPATVPAPPGAQAAALAPSYMKGRARPTRPSSPRRRRREPAGGPREWRSGAARGGGPAGRARARRPRRTLRGRPRTTRRRGRVRHRSRRDWAAAGRPTRPTRGPTADPRRCGSTGLEGCSPA